MQQKSFFPTLRAAVLAGAAIAAGAFAGVQPAAAQQTPTVPTPPPVTTTSPDGTVQTTTGTTTDSTGAPTQTVTTTFHRGRKKDEKKDEKVVQSKDTKKALKKEKTADALIGVDSRLPDKQLYDKALVALKKGHFDVARLDLQTMLNTYPDSQYQMRAKLAIADSWYKEGGTAALTQAESEYADFRVFFPNAPEAAEAQMRIGDIYFRQMDKPDRDYQKAMHAEEEYRRMLTDYPDSVLIKDAKQRLREVQEVMASREADIASFYATRSNWAAVIARYQTVVDSYPLYSHMDDALIGLGDAYSAEARYIRTMKLPEAGKARLEATYDGLAADAYRKVVLEHSAAPHVEDARDRLAAMNLPIPEPTQQQIAASVALENSRASYRLTDRAKLLILHTPDTVMAAREGEPTLTDPKPTIAPTIVKKVNEDFKSAFSNEKPSGAAPVATTAAAPAAETTTAAPGTPTAPLALQDVATGEDAGGAATTLTATPTTAAPATGGGVGIEILPSGSRPAGGNGLNAVGPKNATDLPPAEKPAPAPDQANDITAPTAPAQVLPAGKKKAPKPEFDKGDESSSKHKPKKGIKKVIPPNPF
jgi:outer membrane protein assembly factor BamD